MRAAKRIALLVYLLACSFSVGSLCLAQMGPYTDRFADLLGMRPYRIAVGVCLAIVAVQLLVTLGRVLFAPRPVRDLVYPESTMGIEVSLDALRSSVRAAVEGRRRPAGRRRPRAGCDGCAGACHGSVPAAGGNARRAGAREGPAEQDHGRS